MKRLRSRLTLTKAMATLVVTGAVAVPLFLACTASALVTVGRPLTGTFTPGTPEPTAFTGANLAFPGAGGSAASPVDGVIIRWNVIGAKGSFRLGVLKQTANNFTLTRLSDPASPATTGLQSFSTQLPISVGEIVGLEVSPGSTAGLLKEDTAATVFWNPALTIGQPKPPNEAPGPFTYGFNAEVLPPPTISSVSPTSGPTGGGTSVVISGQNFAKVSAVKFGATPAASFAVASEGTINAVAPAGTGTVPASVTTVAGTATSSSFTYIAPPAPPPAPTCTVPNLKGKTLKLAKKRIRFADCRVGKLTKREGATAKTGEVVRQVPKPGATVPGNTQVKVTLAP
jgi:hypothetical protein